MKTLGSCVCLQFLYFFIFKVIGLVILLAIKMHELFAQVLTNRDLSRAGDLFSIDDNSVVADLSEVLTRIQEIASSSDFIQNDNNQSVVEICITRVTSAIRYLFIESFLGE